MITLLSLQRHLICKILIASFLFLSQLSIGITSSPSNSKISPLQIFTENFPPYSYKDDQGNIQGISINIMKAIQKKLGDTTPINFRPWPEVYQMAITKPNILAFSMTRQQNRENKFHWLGEIAPNQVFFYKLTSRRTLILNTLEESKNFKIGVTREDARHHFLKNKGFQLGQNMIISSSHKNGLERLIKEKIDLWPMPEYVAFYLLQEKKLPTNFLRRILKMPVENEKHAGKYYLVASKTTPQVIIKKWQKALEELHQSGEYDQIIDQTLKKLNFLK